MDPCRARDQYERAVADRAVVAYLNPDGTATVTGQGLAPDEAAAATERIHRLAQRAKRAGHPGTLDHITADIMVGLLDGRFHDKTSQQIVADLLAASAASMSITGVELSVELATLLGHNEHGPAIAVTSRTAERSSC